MNYQEIVKKAKADIGPNCRVCPECNGVACKGIIPGPGGKGTGRGFIRNYNDLKGIALNMDTIYENFVPDCHVELFGKTFDLPVFAGPIGAVQQHYSDKYDDLTYSTALIKGCKAAGSIAFTGDGVVDAVFNGTIEAIGEHEGCGVPTIKPWSKEEVIKKIKMAESVNAAAVAMDIDAAGLTLLGKLGKPVFPMSVETLKAIVDSTELPFILKGVMTAAAAKKAVDAGVYAVLVSNHGGRVLDETPSTISVLEEIIEAVDGKAKILIDGGFRSGIDVFKAIAMGAHGVIIARPYATAIYGGDAEGVKIYTDKIKDELENAMLMTGCKTLSEITRDKVRKL
ncbi:MAG: hypothetical protein PWP51_1606 [Clostridiales bacterium]|jgi:isopentenyl diphosphate isomerase/L-lactate dehydrogenase-like FMN-dependent dehydrogenase|nr:hypothetical protein [Clostridiales bacterium]MDN5299053.1 hypothetical protein [Clostridiales bacterium]